MDINTKPIEPRELRCTVCQLSALISASQIVLVNTLRKLKVILSWYFKTFLFYSWLGTYGCYMSITTNDFPNGQQELQALEDKRMKVSSVRRSRAAGSPDVSQ